MRRRTIVPSAFAVMLSLLLFSTPVAAQDIGIAAPHAGVTVVGYGEASAPAETATLVLSLSEGNFGPTQLPQPGATPGASERRAARPVVDALVGAGIPQDSIRLLVGPNVREIGSYGGPTSAVIVAMVEDPTAARIGKLVDAAQVGAADERLIVSRAGVSYGVADCDALARTARQAAITDARKTGAIQAELLGVTLGGVTGSRDLPLTQSVAYGPAAIALAGGTCAPMDITGTIYGTYALPPFDPTVEPEVSVYAQVELTFAIAGTAEATPAP